MGCGGGQRAGRLLLPGGQGGLLMGSAHTPATAQCCNEPWVRIWMEECPRAALGLARPRFLPYHLAKLIGPLEEGDLPPPSPTISDDKQGAACCGRGGTLKEDGGRVSLHPRRFSQPG